MKRSLNAAGIGHIITLLVIVLVLAAGGAGVKIVQTQNDFKNKQAEDNQKVLVITNYRECMEAEGSVIQKSYPEICMTADGKKFTNTEAEKPKLTQETFKYEKLKLAYDSQYWEKKNQYADINENCGEMEGLILAHKESTITASFGACGKGGGACFSDGTPECKAESIQLAKVLVAPDTYRYVVGHRTSIDAGRTWDYTVGVSDNPTCSSLCAFTARNVQEKVALMGLNTPKYKQVSNDTLTLSDYVKLPEALAGIEVLKSIHY